MSYTIHTDKTIADTEYDLTETFAKWGVRDYAVEFNVPRAKLRNVTLTRQERAVTVRWMPPRGRQEIVLSTDTQYRVQDNLRLLYLGVESIRMNEKRGIDPSVMRSAYMQLSAGGDHWALLDLSPGAPADDVRRAYREKARSAHPDAGGSDEAMSALNRARDAALAEVN